MLRWRKEGCGRRQEEATDEDGCKGEILISMLIRKVLQKEGVRKRRRRQRKRNYEKERNYGELRMRREAKEEG